MSWSVSCECGYEAKDNTAPSESFHWLIFDGCTEELIAYEKSTWGQIRGVCVRIFICPDCRRCAIDETSVKHPWAYAKLQQMGYDLP